MSKPILAVDIDSTIYPFVDSLIEAVFDITEERMVREDFNDWDALQTRFGDEVAEKIFQKALDPKMVEHRQLYPGCKVFLDYVKQMGVDLYFLSHNHDPDNMEESVKRWLAPKFPLSPVKIIHSDNPKIEKLLDVGAIGIIDDKPATLADALEHDLLAATLIHPWNQEFLKENPEVIRFRNWDQAFGSGLATEIVSRCRRIEV